MLSHRVTSLALIVVLFVSSLWLLSHSLYSGDGSSAWGNRKEGYPPYLNIHQPLESVADLSSRRRRNVAFATSFVMHGDVYMAFARSMGEVMDADGSDDQYIHLFAPEFSFGLQEVVHKLNLWTHRGIRANYDQLMHYVDRSSEEGGIDLIVFGTCEFDMNVWHSALVDAWNARREDDKFKIVCVVHNVADTNWQQHIPYWARRSAIRLLPIADHVAKAFRDKFAVQAESPEPLLYTAGYDYIPVDVHVPVLDIPNLPVKPYPRHLEKAVIQGTLDSNRRDYPRVFKDLISSLRGTQSCFAGHFLTLLQQLRNTIPEDPGAWGYLPLEGRPSYVADPNSLMPPFRLLLVGSGWLEIPEELADIVSIHTDLPYDQFYRLVADCDVVVPAFADNTYLTVQASSTVALAAELNVPILVTDRTRRAYGYIDDSRAVITRPAAMPEVQALRALRTGNASAFLLSDPADIGQPVGNLRPIRNDVMNMMHEGWVRDRKGWTEWKAGIWRKNRKVAEKILRDLP